MGWGDELMMTGRAREAMARDPRRVRFVYEKGKRRWHESWEGNPRLALPNEQGDFQELPGRVNWLRPYCSAKNDERWTWQRYTPPKGELYFTDKEQEFGAQHAGLVVIEPSLKGGASPNKDWGWERWVELAGLMRARGIVPAQLGPRDTRLLPGVEYVETPTMRHAAAILAQARVAVLPEGGLHHVAAAVGCPAVVIFGGFISPEVTGYADQVSLFDKTAAHPIGCGWRIPCSHCKAAMAKFPPAAVMAALEQLLWPRANRLDGAENAAAAWPSKEAA